MSVKTKSRKRLVVLLAAAVGVVGLAGGGYGLKVYRNKVYYAGVRETGIRLSSEGRHVEAVSHLGHYLNRHPDDLEVLRLYAKERLVADVTERAAVLDGAAKLRRLVELSPGDPEPRRQLMHLYDRYGFVTEARETADAVLAADPSDVEALQVRARAQARLRQYDKAIETLDAWAAKAPEDVTPHLHALALMAQTNQPPAAIVERARRAGAQDPDGPKAQLVLGVAYRLTGDGESAQRALRQAAAAGKAPTVEFARVLVDEMSRTYLMPESLAVLQQVDQETGDPGIRRALVRRMWEAGRAADVVTLTEGYETLGPEPTALRALSLHRTGKADEAGQVAAALAKPGGAADALAEAWATIVRYETLPGSVEPKALLAACQRGAAKDSPGAYLLYYMGLAYARLDEGDMAVEWWRRAEGVNPTWAMPLIQLSEMRLAKGRYAMAMEEAVRARLRAPQNALAAINHAKVWSAGIEAGQAGRPEELLRLLQELRKELPAEENTLGMYVSLLGRLGRTDEAAREIRSALSATDAPSEGTLLRLAAVSRAHDLGLEDACFARCEQAHGVGVSVAYARAVQKLSRGAAADGLALLKAAREKAARPDDVEWQLAWARYLELAQDPAAKDAWVRLADGRPEDRQVQQAVLNVRSTWQDKEFIDRTIERLRKATGDEGTSWRLARGRWKLQWARNDQDRGEAAVFLKELIRLSEDQLEPRVLLAQAYEQLGNAGAAVEQLQAAARIDPANTQVALSLSRLLQRRGDFAAAKEQLDHVAQAKVTSPEQRRQAAVLLAQQGDTQRAIELLQGTDGGGAASEAPADGLLLAMLYRERNELAKAEEVAGRLLRERAADPAVVQFAADLYARQGKRAEADRVLATLDSMGLKPGVRELLLADHAARFRGADEAVGLFRAAIAADPKNAAAWRALAGFHAHAGRGTELATTAEEGSKALPDDAALRAIAAERELLSAAAAGPETRPLAVAFLADPKVSSPALQAIQAIVREAQGRQTADQTIGQLRKLADESPQAMPLQLLVARRYAHMGRTDEAAQVATRAVEMFPNEAEPARVAVEVMSAAGRYVDALSLARTWRERTAANPVAADLAIASLQVQLGQGKQAVEQVGPYVKVALENPDAWVPVVVQYASSLISAGQSQKAAEIVWPLAEKGATWRNVWLQLAVRADDRTAAAWLERVDPIVPADSPSERSVLAGAWHVLSMRTKDERHAARSAALYDEVMARPDAPADAVLARGVVAEQREDYATAERSYRRALELNPKDVVAMNNLAMLAVKRGDGGGDLAEATRLARLAVAGNPNMATLHDTLGLVQAKAKDVDGAVATFRRAIDLEPNTPDWRIHLAQALFDAGRRPEVERVVREIAALPPNRKPTEAAQRQYETLKQELAKQASTQ